MDWPLLIAGALPMTRLLVSLLSAIFALVVVIPVQAGGVCGPDCEVRYVEKTVCVPQWTTETRIVNCTAYRYETRYRQCTVHRNVFERQQVTKRCTVLVPEQRQCVQNYTVCIPYTKNVVQTYRVCVPEWRDVEYTYCVRKPVWTTVTKRFTVQVPYTEEWQAVRRVCRVVPVHTTRTIRRCVGHWETRQTEIPCGTCRPCGAGASCATRTVCHRVWIPEWVTEEIPCTVYKKEYDEVPYTYHVTLCRPEVRTCEVRVCSYKTEQHVGTRRVCSYRYEQRQRVVPVCAFRYEPRQRNVVYTVCVPRTQMKTFDVVVCRKVAEQVVQPYQVCIPYTVQKQVHTRVCRTVTKTVRVPVYTGCNTCGRGRAF